MLSDIAKSGLGDLKIYRCGDKEYVGDLDTKQWPITLIMEETRIHKGLYELYYMNWIT